jgi:hypothetical protein
LQCAGLCLLLVALLAFQPVTSSAADAPAWAQALLAAYPDHLRSVDGNTLHWRDGPPMELDDGKGSKPFEAWLADPDIEDMLRLPYNAGADPIQPEPDFDPGRARNDAFFSRMYGDCRKGDISANLTEVVWLPKKSGETLKVTKVNGVADRLQAVSRELDDLPTELDRFLFPVGGGFNCRTIAGTSQLSGHGWGFAIDIGVKHSHYWRWSKPEKDGRYVFKNEIPIQIVRVFEKHGFIWGGRWYHFDTMHFEYRPELLPPAAGGGVQAGR